MIVARQLDPIIPRLRDGSFFARIPGNKLPGYDHFSPSGTKSDSPVGTVDLLLGKNS